MATTQPSVDDDGTVRSVLGGSERCEQPYPNWVEVEESERLERSASLAQYIVENRIEEYKRFMWLFVGDPEQERRDNGERPWPKQENRVYSRQVFAGFDPVSERLVYLGNDPWKSDNDPRALMFIEMDVKRGTIYERKVLVSNVTGHDDKRTMWAQFVPQADENGVHNPNLSMHLFVDMDDNYRAIGGMTVNSGRFSSTQEYIDIELLSDEIARRIDYIEAEKAKEEMSRQVGRNALMA